MTGVGGGIFLALLVLSLGWAATRQTAAISVVVQPPELGFCPCWDMGYAAAVARRAPSLARLRGTRRASRLMDGLASTHDLAVAVSFPVARRVGGDCCLF